MQDIGFRIERAGNADLFAEIPFSRPCAFQLIRCFAARFFQIELAVPFGDFSGIRLRVLLLEILLWLLGLIAVLVLLRALLLFLPLTVLSRTGSGNHLLKENEADEYEIFSRLYLHVTPPA